MIQRKRRRLSEVAYSGYKKFHLVKKITKLNHEPITGYFLCLTTMVVAATAIAGLIYCLVVQVLMSLTIKINLV